MASSSLCMSSWSTGTLGLGLNTKRAFDSSSSSVTSLRFTESRTVDLPLLKNEFKGKQALLSDQTGVLNDWNSKTSTNIPVHASMCVSRALRWWEKTLKPNMIEIKSAQELHESLRTAGDQLVIIDFYSPGCGGCKALHPKICQLAELNPNALFFKVNYEELKSMCYSLNIHVLPFFRLYRGAEGRVCSFSCTNATIKKFKDALAKHGTERCSLGPAKGLEESELRVLAAKGEISLDYLSRSISSKEEMGDLILGERDLSNSFSSNRAHKLELINEKVAMVA